MLRDNAWVRDPDLDLDGILGRARRSTKPWCSSGGTSRRRSRSTSPCGGPRRRHVSLRAVALPGAAWRLRRVLGFYHAGIAFDK